MPGWVLRKHHASASFAALNVQINVTKVAADFTTLYTNVGTRTATALFSPASPVHGSGATVSFAWENGADYGTLRFLDQTCGLSSLFIKNKIKFKKSEIGQINAPMLSPQGGCV